MQFGDYFAMKSLAPGMTSAIINRLGALLTVLLGADYNLPLVDSFVVRTITVPAMAALVGRANWWPSRPEQTRNPLGARAPRGSCVCSANRG